MIGRREFITLLGSAAAWPIAARAQQGERMRRIGVLLSTGEDNPQRQAQLAAFVQRLTELGWADGHKDQSLYSSMLATAALRASAHWLESFR